MNFTSDKYKEFVMNYIIYTISVALIKNLIKIVVKNWVLNSEFNTYNSNNTIKLFNKIFI